MDMLFVQVCFIWEYDIYFGIIFVFDYVCCQFLDNFGLKINEFSIFVRVLIECDENNVVMCVIVL